MRRRWERIPFNFRHCEYIEMGWKILSPSAESTCPETTRLKKTQTKPTKKHLNQSTKIINKIIWICWELSVCPTCVYAVSFEWLCSWPSMKYSSYTVHVFTNIHSIAHQLNLGGAFGGHVVSLLAQNRAGFAVRSTFE